MATDRLPKIRGITAKRWRVYCIYRDAKGPITLTQVKDWLGLRAVSTVHEVVQWLIDHKLMEEIPDRDGGHCGKYRALPVEHAISASRETRNTPETLPKHGQLSPARCVMRL